MKKLFLAVILLALPLVVSAYDVEIDGIYYNLNREVNEAEVTCQKFDYTNGYHSDYSGIVVIPENFKYEGIVYSVTSIGNGAFSSCSNLKSVTISNSVTIIGSSAFYGCTSLSSVVISNSVTSIGRTAFYNCRSLTSLNIPNSVLHIQYGAFWGCTSLSILTIPSSVMYINERAFADCTSLTSVSIPGSVTIIENSLFSGCINLTSVTIPSSVTTIENGAFYGCRSLTSVSIPNSVVSIGESAFCDCVGLTSLIIPNSVTYIGRSAFWNCTSLTSLTIPNSVTSIGHEVCAYCSKLDEVYCFAETVPSTPTDAFHDSNCQYSTLYVPAKSVNSYKTTLPWSSFGTILAICNLTYFVDGVEFSSYILREGESIIPDAVPTKEGYTFSGWSEIPTTMPASDVTITGSFTINKYKLTYTLDGEEYKTAEVDYGTTLTPEEAPVKEGYTFSGWSEIPSTMPANDVTVTGTFTANKYKLTYMVDGEEYKASEVDYGTAITAEAVPTKEGYTFSGWSEIPSTMPAEDVTVTGTFTVNKYTITYMVDNTVLMTEEVAYGSTIAPPKSQKDGYDILWSFYPTTMPAYSITINGTYTTGIKNLSMEEKDRQVFTPDGKRVETPKKGLNIIRMSDGTVKKVVVK